MSKDTTINITSLTKEEQQFITERKLDDKYFIGRFNEKESGYLVSDIRRSDFSKIKYKPENSEAFTIEVDDNLAQNIKDDCYYRFSWIMVKSEPNYVFEVDTKLEITPVLPKDIVNMLYKDMYNCDPRASQMIVNTLDTIKNQLTASGKEVFIYELLQNANDYPQKVNEQKIPVEVEFHITDNYLIFQHSGDYFNAKNIEAICSINDKEKTDNAEAIGYKGSGFKTVFLDNNYVLLRTGDYQFRFDYDYTKNIEDTAWQILPIWTEDKNVDNEILEVMDNADDKYRVQIALRPTESDILHTGEQNYEELFSDVFETERVILFIPFVNSVSVYMNGEKTPSIVRVKQNDKWCVSDPEKYVGSISPELTEELNRRIKKGDGKIPEKYYNFRKTSVGFACRREGNKLCPVENSCLYCYLPAKKAKLGFGFLMNTDMIPTGPRDNVEPKENINHAIAKIAGQQFFKWIHDLLEEGQFDYESVFSLIPDFEELENRHDDDEDVLKFITEFREGFEDELEKESIIPIINEEGNTILIPVNNVNYDTTGITCAGILSDEKLLEITDWTDSFVHPDLRDTENLCLKPNIARFLECYASDAYKFDENVLLTQCEQEAFSKWLSEENNNYNFLNFLVTKDYIIDFENKDILLTETGEELKSANNIYYDIDDYYDDLKAFDDYLPRLSKGTRSYFKDNKVWESIKNNIFRQFNPDAFVDSELRDAKNINDTFARLKDPETSYGFFNFLAQNVSFTPSYKKFPVIRFNSTVIEDFKGIVYFYHKDGEELSNQCWVQESWVNLLSENYSPKAKEYFKENFGVKDFSLKSYIEDVLLKDSDIQDGINELGQNHIDFVHYCYAHKECFNKNVLKNFSLWTYDKENQNEHILSEDVIFFANDDFSVYQSKSWIQNGWMYKLDNEYFDGIEDINDFKQFVADVFHVYDFNQENFYNCVVAKNAKSICKDIGGTETDNDVVESIDFLTYLGENYKLIFEDNNYECFVHLPLYRYDVWNEVTDRTIDVYLYDEELKDVIEADWTPEDFVYMLDERYNKIFSTYPMLCKKLEVKKYTFKSIIDILLDELTSHEDCINDKEANISFHRFMHNNKDDIDSKNYKKIKNLKIYAANNNGVESPHKIDDTIYISNAYMEEGRGMENMVKKYDKTAVFTSDSYLYEDADIQEIKDWKEYFVKLGVNSDNKDIIFNSVLPNLAEIKDKDIVSLLAGYYDYFHADGEWDDTLKKLKQMNVVVKGGDDDFRPLKDVLFNDCYGAEPYPYLIIEDEIASFYKKSPDVMRLLREIVDDCKEEKTESFRSFKTIDEWKAEKLEWYLYLQKDNISNIEAIHSRFIYDLAMDYTLNYSLYTKVKVKEILLLGKDGQYHKAKELTEGTAYQPRCNFEKYGIPLIYLSENYLPVENPDPKDFRSLFKDMEVIYDFHSEHLSYMRDNYQFTLYFWTKYLTIHANRTHIIAGGINDSIAKELNNYATIPTGNRETHEVKKPIEIYSRRLICDGYVKGMIPFYENRMPLEEIFSTDEVNNILDNLDFATTLSFSDCIECLLRTKNKEKRQTILRWLSTKHSIDHILVNKYLNDDNSIWRNGKGIFVPLRNLLVLNIEDDKIRQLFGKNEKVMSQEYIDSTLVFDSFCKIFGIKALSKDDFELSPEVIDEPTTEEMQQKLRLPLLIVAAVSEPDNWKDKYKHFCSDLDQLIFHKCDSITLNYKGILKDSSIQYHKNDKELFFVRDWMGRRVFKDFIYDLVNDLDIDLDNNVLEAIFEADESNQVDLIEQYVNYEVSKSAEFNDILMKLNVTIAEGVHFSYEEDEEEEDVASTFGTNTRSEINEGEDGESEDETDYNSEEDQDEVEESTTTYSEQTEEESEENESMAGNHDSTESSSSEQSNQHDSNFNDGDEEDKYEEEYCDTDDDDDDIDSYQKYKSDDKEDSDSEEQDFQEGCTRNEQQHASSTNSSYHSNEGNNRCNADSYSSKQHGKPSSEYNESSSYGSGHSGDYNERSQHRDSTDRESYKQDVDFAHGKNQNTRRKNYMGYNPDETKQRPFNVGKQEATTLETKDATEDDVSRLSALLGRAFDRDSIVDENYLVRMRFYNSVKENVGDPQMTEKEFVEKGSKYLQTKNGKYVHRCSARGGILYISPSIWNRVKFDNCIICMYYGKKANQFLYIRSQKELMDMIDKDAVVVQVTGNDKGVFINKVYDSKFPGMNGNIYTMIRTIKTSGDDFIFGENDLNSKNDIDFDPDLV